ncbi:MAG: hypothetical protein ACT4QF_09395 [Sporichthyaceae bacterium]
MILGVALALVVTGVATSLALTTRSGDSATVYSAAPSPQDPPSELPRAAPDRTERYVERLETPTPPPVPVPRIDPSTPITADKRLLGNAHPVYPLGKPGAIDVVHLAFLVPELLGSTLALVVRNNSDLIAADIELDVRVRKAGQMLAGGNNRGAGTYPTVVPPGGLALVYVTFDQKLPVDPSYTYDFVSAAKTPWELSAFKPAISPQVTEANRVGNSVVGTLQNQSTLTLTGPFAVTVFCYDTSQSLLYRESDIDYGGGDLSPGVPRSFSVDLPTDRPCPLYIVGARAHVRVQ